CDVINLMDHGIFFDQISQNYTLKGSFTNQHCPNQNCDNDDKKISSAFIAFLNYFNGTGIDKNLDSDKIAEYAILWLGHKLNQKTQNGTTKLNDFYTKQIKTNSKYEENIFKSNRIKKNDIENKIESMNIDIKDIFNFYEVFKLLCKMGDELDKNKGQCNICLKSAGEFYKKYENVKNGLDIDKGSSYLQLLFSLSKDYDKFKEKYKTVCGDTESLETCLRSSVTKSPVKECSVKEIPVTECPVKECPVTKSILIPIAIIFVVASFFFGISYKFLCCGTHIRPKYATKKGVLALI
ncbi:putative yir3 protein, partial [Plasmodium yoelii yoelii]